MKFRQEYHGFLPYDKWRKDDLYPELHPLRTPDWLNSDRKTQNLEVKSTSKNQTGEGLFARKEIAASKSNLVFVSDGNIATEQALGSFWQAAQRPNAIVVNRSQGQFRADAHPLNPNFGPFLYANPPDNNPLRYLNHSCNPNVVQLREDPFSFRAWQNIKLGTQIVGDYSLMEVNESWRMQCACGSPDCRKEIRAIQFLAPNYVAKYWETLADHMRYWYLEQSPDKSVREYVKKYGADKADEDFVDFFS